MLLFSLALANRAPKDMNTSFATVIHCAPKLDIKELMVVRKSLSSVLPPEFVRECDTNYDLINPVVSTQIVRQLRYNLGRLKYRL